MKNSRHLKNSLANQLFRITLIPLVVLTIFIVVISVSIIYNAMTSQVEEDLRRDADLVLYMYEKVYDGDFHYVEDENGKKLLYKGDEILSGDDSIVANVAEIENIEVTLFLEDKRILTTLVDSKGNVAIGTSCSPIVTRDVLETGEDHFYSNVTVYNQRAFAYYRPLIAGDGKVYGMIAVCRTASVVVSDAARQIWPIVVICIMASVFIGVIMWKFTKKLRNRLSDMDIYMDLLAAGDFSAEMPRAIMADDDELKRLAREAKKMARAIQNLVDYDALTELNNRRYGEKKLEEIRTSAEETGTPYSVCISDIDYFKKVNDTYGHEMGDVILKEVADKLKDTMIGRGFAARWGGEEFILVFDASNLEQATSTLEYLLEDIRTIIIPGTDEFITMSFGITLGIAGESIDESLKRADENLYEAKENGRNQIVAK